MRSFLGSSEASAWWGEFSIQVQAKTSGACKQEVVKWYSANNINAKSFSTKSGWSNKEAHNLYNH